MAVALEPLVFDKFKGIREFNGVNAGGEISALVCENVELVQTEIGGTTGIKSMNGVTELYNLPTGYVVKGLFTSEQDNKVYELIYAENTTAEKGRLYYINPTDDTVTLLIDDLTVTGECNGVTMSSSAYDVFIFTNGEEAYSVCFTTDISYPYQTAEPINFTISDNTKTYKTDYEGNDIKFLAMAVWNGFLVVATDYGVRGSRDNDIYTWNDNPTDISKSWYINYTEKVTALYAYTGGLFIFTDDNTDFLNTTPNNTAASLLQTTAGVGCHNYNSIVKHDTYLFFYSDIQKNIYMIQNIDNGQTRPTGPLAKEIQSAFKLVKDFKMYSCIYDNKNEIWCIITDLYGNVRVYIYNYFQGEWVMRKERENIGINALCLIHNTIHTGNDNKIYCEFMNSLAGFYASRYKTCFINAGSNTNLKKQKTPLLLVLNDSYINDFWVQLTVNGKQKSEKHIKLSTGESGIYGSTGETLTVTPQNQKYGTSATSTKDCALYGEYNNYSRKVVEVSTPQTWYTMSVEIKTKTNGEGFYICSMELKNMKAKLKTKGR